MSPGVANRAEDRREALAAVVVSVLLHLLLILGAAWLLLRAVDTTQAPSATEEEPMRLTILPPVPKATPKPQFLATPAKENLERAPSKDAAFESDNDSLAASESPPDGTEPLPSVQGIEAPGIQLQEQQHTAGKPERPTPPAAQPAQATAPNNPPAEAQPTPRPVENAAPLVAPNP